MISSHESFRFGPPGNELNFEVNWNTDKDVIHCQKIRVNLPNGEKFVIKRDELNAMLFAMGKPDEQMKMIPQRTQRSKWYETVVSVQATKPIRKGEKITFPIKLALPTIEEEVVAEVKKDVLKSNYPLIGQ
jgi:hypothetical protein